VDNVDEALFVMTSAKGRVADKANQCRTALCVASECKELGDYRDDFTDLLEALDGWEKASEAFLAATACPS